MNMMPKSVLDPFWEEISFLPLIDSSRPLKVGSPIHHKPWKKVDINKEVLQGVQGLFPSPIMHSLKFRTS